MKRLFVMIIVVLAMGIPAIAGADTPIVDPLCIDEPTYTAQVKCTQARQPKAVPVVDNQLAEQPRSNTIWYIVAAFAAIGMIFSIVRKPRQRKPTAADADLLKEALTFLVSEHEAGRLTDAELATARRNLLKPRDGHTAD